MRPVQSSAVTWKSRPRPLRPALRKPANSPLFPSANAPTRRVISPIATARIEDLMDELKKDYTIVVVTHNMQQAARVSDWTAFMSVDISAGGRTGHLVEFGRTEQIFTHPSDPRTEGYITGRFG